MLNKLSWITSGLLLLACVYLFFALFESYPEEVDTGWNEAALFNPYLAAQQFLQHQGILSESLDSLPQKEQLAHFQTLFIEDSRDVLSRHQVSTLRDWVKQGGYLIIAAHLNTDDAGDPLLAEFAITLERTECDCQKYLDETETEKNADTEEVTATEAKDKTEKQRPLSQWLRQVNKATATNAADHADSPQIDPANLTSLSFENKEETLNLYFNPRWALIHPFFDHDEEETFSGIKPLYWAGSEWGVHFVQFRVGEGFITVMSDASIWRSENIAEQDSAYLLSVLTGGHIGFLTGHQMPSFFSLIWQHAQEALIAFAVWLILWLCYRGRRFLPPSELNHSVRRSIAEHIEAVAYFLWQRQATEKLLRSLREEVHHRAALNIHGYNSLSLAQRMQAIATHSQVPAQAVTTALTTEGSCSEEQFTHIIQSLQKIRSTL